MRTHAALVKLFAAGGVRAGVSGIVADQSFDFARSDMMESVLQLIASPIPLPIERLTLARSPAAARRHRRAYGAAAWLWGLRQAWV